MKHNSNEELGRLISRLLDGDIADEEHMRLATLLAESAKNRKEYLEFIRIESLLHWESEDILKSVSPKTNTNKTILFSFPLWLGSAAAVLLAMSAIWWTQKPTQPGEVVSENQPTKGYAEQSTANEFAITDNSQFIDKLKPSHLPKFNPLSSSNLSIEDQSVRAIENLLSPNDAPSEGIIEYFGSVKRWSRLHKMLVPSENGILPASGSKMIGLDDMSISIDTQTAQVEETVQVLDIRDALKDASQNEAKIFAAVKFNQSFGESQEGAEFGITLQAFKKEGDSIPMELIRSEQKLFSDRNPSTWDELSSELIIPEDAQFLVVSLSARKHGPDSVLANSSSYYADDLQLYLSFDDQSTVGPI